MDYTGARRMMSLNSCAVRKEAAAKWHLVIAPLRLSPLLLITEPPLVERAGRAGANPRASTSAPQPYDAAAVLFLMIKGAP